jgi:hypothetical protein
MDFIFIVYAHIPRYDSNVLDVVDEEEQDVTFEGEEENILTKFHEYFENKDPDILIFSSDNYKDERFYDLITKMNELGFDIGRELSISGKTNNIYYFLI